jgi:micrococcal nuclease
VAILGTWLLLGCGAASTLTTAPQGGTTTGPTGPTGPTQLAHVTRITDGDTIRVDIKGTEYRLRYIGMDTPESVKPGTPVEPYAKAAAARNAALVADRDVILEKDVSETDRYGRLLRYVWLHHGDAWLMANMELVRTGYAQVLTYPPDVKYASEFVNAERAARDAGLGLWAPDTSP